MRHARLFAILPTLFPAAPGQAALVRATLEIPPASVAAPPVSAPAAAGPTPSLALPAISLPAAAPAAVAPPLAAAAAASAVAPLYDAAPAAPDFAALSPVPAPQAPAPWTPSAPLLRPAAAAFNAVRGALHRRRLSRLGPEERVTADEASVQDSLTAIHAALAGQDPQDALSGIFDNFQTRAASSWYGQNPRYRPYREQAHAYLRFAEGAIKSAYERAAARGADVALVAEAAAAARDGRILGHAWRPTASQGKNSSHCVQNALYNAIAASVGFAAPTTIPDFVAASRAALNREARLDRPASAAEIAELARILDLNLGRRDVDNGMDEKALAEWTSWLGLTLASRAPPRTEADWSALLGSGREALLGLRLFHARYRHSPEEAETKGHAHPVLHHEVYLLGAFDSAALGARLFLIQDSGSGATLLATAAELTALTREVSLLDTGSAPVRLPAAP